MKAVIVTGATLGLTSVMMAAAGDHLFSTHLTAGNVERLDVALRYHQLYAILIFCMGLYGLNSAQNVYFKIAASFFIGGTVIFCTSLYASLLTKMEWLTYLTPIGGLMLMGGWISSALILKTRQSSI